MHWLNGHSFGQQLRTSLLKEYYYYYLSYDQLKASLKTPYESEPTSENPSPSRRAWNEDDEKAFVAELEGELDKVFTFQRVKSGEIVRRIKVSEREVNDVISRLEAQGPRSSSQSGHVGPSEGDVPTEDEFQLLEQDLSDIIADVHDLAKFTQLNYTGFQKIIKKHDVRHQELLSNDVKLTVFRNKRHGTLNQSLPLDSKPNHSFLTTTMLSWSNFRNSMI